MQKASHFEDLTDLKPLKGLKICDMSSRLPGPMATNFLLSLGASVTKVELEADGDPFSHEEIKKVEPLFYHWYENLNEKKVIQKIPTIDALLQDEYDLLIINPHKKIDLSKITKPALIIKASKSGTPLHDLNALMLARAFRFYGEADQDDLPFLPFAGVSFAQSIALAALSLLISKEKGLVEIYMDQEVKRVFDQLVPTEHVVKSRYLHNGAFPCYQIYKLTDGLLGVACVEEKFWVRFCEGLELNALDAFDRSGEAIKKIQNTVSSMETYQIRQLFGADKLPLSVYKKGHL